MRLHQKLRKCDKSWKSMKKCAKSRKSVPNWEFLWYAEQIFFVRRSNFFILSTKLFGAQHKVFVHSFCCLANFWSPVQKSISIFRGWRGCKKSFLTAAVKNRKLTWKKETKILKALWFIDKVCQSGFATLLEQEKYFNWTGNNFELIYSVKFLIFCSLGLESVWSAGSAIST